MGISSGLISSGFSGIGISSTFNISSWSDFNSSSEACRFSVSFP